MTHQRQIHDQLDYGLLDCPSLHQAHHYLKEQTPPHLSHEGQGPQGTGQAAHMG